MKSLPANLIIEKNRLHSPDPWLILLEITLTDGTVLRFARNTEDVMIGTSIPENCIAFWKMNDNAASATVVDTMGNHDGTYHGTGGADDYTDAHSVAGKVNTALEFDGIQDYLTALLQTFITAAGTYSISAWIKTTSTAGQVIIQNSQGGSDRNGISVADDTVRFGHYDGEGWSVKSGSITRNVYHHIVAINNNGVVSLYIDNVLQTGTTAPLVDTNSAYLYIGSHSTGAHFAGAIDNMMIFNRALTEEEKTALWNEGNGTECPGNTYTAFPFEIEPTKQTSRGEIPTLTVRVSNITRLIQPYLEALDGGIGSIVKITVVNSAHLSENYSELEMTFDVLACDTSAEWVTFTLGAPNPLRQRFPLHKYLALHCRWTYKLAECGYAGKAISGITKANPGVVTAAAHGFATDDYIYHDEVEGMEEVNGQIYQITKLTDDTYSIVDTSGFTVYTSGGIASYSACKRILEDCREHENAARFGGFVGMRSSGIRIV